MPRLLVAAVTDVGHQDASLKFTADARVDTLGSSPAGLQGEMAVRNGIAAGHIVKEKLGPDRPIGKLSPGNSA